MKTWTERGIVVTRRRYERRLDEVFGSARGRGERVMLHAREAGLVSTGKQGLHYDRPLLPRECASLILLMALSVATALTMVEAADLVARRQDWVRHALSVAVTGEDLVLQHAFGDGLAVEVTIRNTVLRDPVLGVGGVVLDAVAA
jgi:hypothetical protein